MSNPKWKYHDDYVQCADCQTLRPLAELSYRKHLVPIWHDKPGEHHCTDAEVCAKLREDKRAAPPPQPRGAGGRFQTPGKSQSRRLRARRGR